MAGTSPAMTNRSRRLRPLRLLALERAEAGAVALVVQKLLHPLRAAVFLVVEAQGIAFGVEVIRRLRLVHETNVANGLLGVAQNGRALFHQLVGELDGLLLELR